MRCQSCNEETGDTYYLLGKFKARVCYSSTCMVNYINKHRNKEGDDIVKYVKGKIELLNNEDVIGLLKKWDA